MVYLPTEIISEWERAIVWSKQEGENEGSPRLHGISFWNGGLKQSSSGMALWILLI